MSDPQNKPREYDAVLGGKNSIPVNAAVLGGIGGVKSRLASPAIEARIAALSEAPKYGEAGLDLIIQMGNNPSYFKGSKKRPVEQVSWNDAVKFCEKLSKTTRKTYRLLSEAEWEYACRAGTTTPFHLGETSSLEFVNYDVNCSIDVGSFPPNAFGLYDMHGQVWEWCSDQWHDNYDGAPTDGSSWETGTNNHRLLRGGSWYSEPDCCRSTFRNHIAPNDVNCGYGFRVACVAAWTS